MSQQSSLRARQRQLMSFILHDDHQIQDEVAETDNMSAHDRLAIYHNAYRLRLREVIDTDHPILGIYLGDDLFDLMVKHYIDDAPSKYTSLRNYCDNLPDFLAKTLPFGDHPQISELARFERLLLTAFDAEDKSTAIPQDLQNLPAEEWPHLTIRFHPSLQIFITEYNVVETWQALKQEQSPPETLQQHSCWVLWRNTERLTEFKSISAIEQQMLKGFLEGNNLSYVAELIIQELNEQDAAQSLLSILNAWLDMGWIQMLQAPTSQPSLTISN